MKAIYAGRCVLCETKIAVGDEIVRYGEHWFHDECADGERKKALILADETFRSGKTSDWQRKMKRE